MKTQTITPNQKQSLEIAIAIKQRNVGLMGSTVLVSPFLQTRFFGLFVDFTVRIIFHVQ